ncbi:MAG: glycosyltransferase, partial [Ferruginibacter sp.]
MSKIILDCDLMRHKDSGLYHYCLNLGHYVQKALAKNKERKISFYIPNAEKRTFGPQANCLVEKKWHHKVFNPFLLDCDIWHAPFQSGRVLPPNNKRIKVVLTIHDLNCLHEDKPDKERVESLQKTQQLIDNSHAIVCISHHSKKDVLTHLNVKDKPVHVIHNGTHQVDIPPEKPAGLRPSKPFLFTMGYVNRKKNFHTVVSLLKDTDFDLVVAGKLDEPEYINKMHLLSTELGVSDRMHILGP